MLILGSALQYCFTLFLQKGMGDSEYIAAFQQVVMPIAYQFNPQLVLVSAGFDACVGDPLGGCKVTPEMYGHLTHWLSSLAHGRIILSLEGGYNVNSISYAMTMCVKTLLGDPLPTLERVTEPHPSAVLSICNVLNVQKIYWPNLKFRMALPKELDVLVSDVQSIADAFDHLTVKEADGEKGNGEAEKAPPPQEEASSSAATSSQAGASGSAVPTLSDFLSDNLQVRSIRN